VLRFCKATTFYPKYRFGEDDESVFGATKALSSQSSEFNIVCRAHAYRVHLDEFP
jgi:hypothetical protein